MSSSNITNSLGKIPSGFVLGNVNPGPPPPSNLTQVTSTAGSLINVLSQSGPNVTLSSTMNIADVIQVYSSDNGQANQTTTNSIIYSVPFNGTVYNSNSTLYTQTATGVLINVPTGVSRNYLVTLTVNTLMGNNSVGFINLSDGTGVQFNPQGTPLFSSQGSQFLSTTHYFIVPTTGSIALKVWLMVPNDGSSVVALNPSPYAPYSVVMTVEQIS